VSWLDQEQPNPGGQGDNTNADVSCPNVDACTTVGSWVDAGDAIRTLAERWDGTTWVRQPAPNPRGSDISELNGVSCPSVSTCTAVGDWASNADQIPSATLAVHWNGTTWGLEATSNPPGGRINTLNGVACPSTETCVAVGDSWDGLVTSTLVEEYSG
jgi:hypothetical protein